MHDKIVELGGPFTPRRGESADSVLRRKAYFVGEILGLFAVADIDNLPSAVAIFNQVAGFAVSLRPEGEEGPFFRY